MAFGVDLGTTNSSIAWADPTGAVYSLKVRRGPKEPFDAVERSLVLDPLGHAPVVGHLAAGSPLPRADAPLVSSFKYRFDKARLRQARYEVEASTTGEYDPVGQCIKFKHTWRRVPVYYDDYSLDEVIGAAGLILRRLLGSTEVDLGPPRSGDSGSRRSVVSRLLRRPDDASATAPSTPHSIDAQPGERLYVGVPVSFGPTARRRLLRSLVQSGEFGEGPDAYREVLERCRIVYEPLAVVSTLSLFEPQNVLIVDYGGGTLDLALLSVDPDEQPSRVKELALGGLPTAGDRFDELFREYLLETRPGLRQAYEQQVAAGGQDKYAAISAFTRAKVDLSTKSSTIIRLFGDLEVSRNDLERAIASELDKALLAVASVVARGGIDAATVGTVVLTGGSSLIPTIQDRLRAAFPHLDDDLSFDAGTPGDIESERRALTGVSRGLAQFGFRQSLETSAPCTFSLVIPGQPVLRAPCLERGTPDVFDLGSSPVTRLPVMADTRCSVVLYSDLVRETYCGAIADIVIPSAGELEVRVSAHRDRFAPAFVVHRPDGEEVGRFDLEAMTSAELQRWVEGDSEWMPLDHPRVESAFLTRPLELGDFVEFRWHGNYRRGKVLEIRDLDANEHVERMKGFNPEPYVIRVALEEGGVVKLSHTVSPSWKVGDVRLA